MNIRDTTKMKNKILFQLARFCGMLTLSVGLIIFFSWWAARAFYAVDLDGLEVLGLYWVSISLILALAGLVFISVFCVSNFPKFIKSSLFIYGLILINIPVLYLVLQKQDEISKRVYLKVINETSRDSLDICVSCKGYQQSLGQLNKNEPTINHYLPQYVGSDYSDRYLDTTYLVVKQKNIVFHMAMPNFHEGNCETIFIQSDFTIRDEKDSMKMPSGEDLQR